MTILPSARHKLRTALVLSSAALALAVFMVVVACYAPVDVDIGTAASETETPVETASLPPLVADQIHADLGYPLDRVATDKIAPRVFVDTISVDLNRIRDVDEKKAAFIRILLPIVAAENDRIRAERHTIEKAGEAPDAIYEEYGVEPGHLEVLLRRLDVVPASLVLAKAALESGWGTSRFARAGNNLFGMRTYDENTPGIDPKRAEGFKVIKFRDLQHGVRAYLKNMNTHAAYKDFRIARAKARDAGEPPAGRPLTRYLAAYSEIPEKYGKRLRAVMDQNDLDRFDGVRLASR